MLVANHQWRSCRKLFFVNFGSSRNTLCVEARLLIKLVGNMLQLMWEISCNSKTQHLGWPWRILQQLVIPIQIQGVKYTFFLAPHSSLVLFSQNKPSQPNKCTTLNNLTELWWVIFINRWQHRSTQHNFGRCRVLAMSPYNFSFFANLAGAGLHNGHQ